MNRIGLAAAAFLAMCPASLATAQTPLLEPGTRVRVVPAASQAAGVPQMRTERITGYVDRVSGDSVWIHLEATDGPLVSIDRADIRELQISSGRKRNPGKGALWGAGAGLSLGILAAVTIDDDCFTGNRFFDFCDGEEDTIILGSTMAGAAWGALIGLLITSERWITIPPESVMLRSERGGVSLSLRIPF